MIVLSAWVCLRGYLATEVFGSLHQLITDPARLYQAHIRTIMLGMGYDPRLIHGMA